jgi:hypothetical protein
MSLLSDCLKIRYSKLQRGTHAIVEMIVWKIEDF